MAVRNWRGKQGVVRKQMRWTCNAEDGIFSLIHNLKRVAYTFVSGNTAADVVAGLVAAAQNSGEPEFQELGVAADGNDVTVLGPEDGGTVAVTVAVTGSATMTPGTTIDPVSPHDVADTANYDTFPVNNDTLVLPKGSADLKYNLEALNGVTGLTIIREAEGPNIGLPDYRADGYLEYRPTRLKAPAVKVTINTTPRDAAGAMRLHLSSETCEVTIIGDANAAVATLGDEVVEVVSSGTGSTLSIVNSSVAIAPLVGSVATIAGLEGDDSAVRLGSGLGLADAELNGCTSEVGCDWTGAITQTGTNSVLTTVNTATGTLRAEEGTVVWNSTGELADPTLGPNVTLDLSGGAGPVAVSGSIVKNEGAAINDPGSRLVIPYAVDCVRSGVDGLNIGRHLRVTVDAVAAVGGYIAHDPHGSARESDEVVYTTGSYTPPWLPTGIVASAAGVVIGQLLDDTVDGTYGVGIGTNPLRFKSITEAGTTATDLYVVRG